MTEDPAPYNATPQMGDEEMKPTREKALQWAVEEQVGYHDSAGGFLSPWQEDADISEYVIALVLRAYAEGQRDMRERAANVASDMDYSTDDAIARCVRNLEIEE